MARQRDSLRLMSDEPGSRAKPAPASSPQVDAMQRRRRAAREAFADRLKTARESRHVSMNELARRMVYSGWGNYKAMTVSRTEAGKRDVGLDEAMSLAGCLNVPFEHLAGIDVSEEKNALELSRANYDLASAFFDLSDAIYRYLNALEDAHAAVFNLPQVKSLGDATKRDLAALERTFDGVGLDKAIIDQVTTWVLNGGSSYGVFKSLAEAFRRMHSFDLSSRVQAVYKRAYKIETDEMASFSDGAPSERGIWYELDEEYCDRFGESIWREDPKPDPSFRVHRESRRDHAEKPDGQSGP